MSLSVFTLPDGSNFSIIKPLIGFRSQIEKQLKKFPYEKNVFLMMRFRKANDGISDAIIEILKDAGLIGVRADQPVWSITKNVFNPIAVLYCCKYGIAVLDEAEENQIYSPNVIYELGMMHCLERECLILKKDSLPPIPFDLLKNLYKVFGGKVAIRTNVRLWLQEMGLEADRDSSSVKPKGETKLEKAAVEATSTTKKQATIVAPPDDVKATNFTWTIKSKDPKKWTVSWGLKIINQGNKLRKYKVQVLFLEKNFALDDHSGPTSQPVLPGKTLSYKATSTVSPEIAERISRAMATVSSIRG